MKLASLNNPYNKSVCEKILHICQFCRNPQIIRTIKAGRWALGAWYLPAYLPAFSGYLPVFFTKTVYFPTLLLHDLNAVHNIHTALQRAERCSVLHHELAVDGVDISRMLSVDCNTVDVSLAIVRSSSSRLATSEHSRYAIACRLCASGRSWCRKMLQ